MFTVMAALGVLLIVAALVVRVWIFNTMDDDPTVAEVMEGSLPVQTDLLPWELWRRRNLVARHHRWKADLYFWLHVAAIAALLGALLIKEFG